MATKASTALGKYREALLPSPRTKHCDRFITAMEGILAFERLVTEQAEIADYGLGQWITAKFNSALTPETVERFRDPVAAPFTVASEKLESVEGFLAELLLCRAVDTYETFVTDALNAVFLKRPEILKSEAAVTLEEVLEHATFAELFHYLAGKRVDGLRGFSKLLKFVKNKLGLPLVGEKHLDKVTNLAVARNTIVHNNGIVTKRTASQFRSAGWLAGDSVVVTLDSATDACFLLWRCGVTFDKRLCKKYGLEQPVEQSEVERKQD